MEVKQAAYQLCFNFPPKTIEYNLIDDHFDIEFANQLAEIESYNKHLYRPNTYLHKWWARRCGTTFRSILKHLVRDANKKEYYTPGGLEGQIILDPMMGGGTTLHEAIRLGANVIGADIDPIPILQVRAALTDTPLGSLQDAFHHFFEELQTHIGHLYRVACPMCEQPYELKFVLYGIKKSCQDHDALFIDNFHLRYNQDGSIVHICPQTYDVLLDQQVISRCIAKPDFPLYEKSKKQCSRGGKFIEDVSIPFYQRYVPLIFVGECPEHGLFFAASSQSDLDLIEQANQMRGQLPFNKNDFKITSGPKSSDLIKRGVENYLDLFTSRQLLYLSNAIDILKRFDHPISLKLALLVSASIEFNALLCGYKGAGKNRPGAIRHTFAHHAYAFPFTAMENNPVYRAKSSGTLQNIFHNRFVRGYKWALNPIERAVDKDKRGKVPIQGELDLGVEQHKVEDLAHGQRRFLLIQGSSAKLALPSQSVDHVVTDPPYYDSVQYGDLAAFFRVWLKHLLPHEINWDYSAASAAVDQHSNGDGQYEAVLSQIFKECHRVIKNDRGRLIFTFHHWNPKGWAALTCALKNAGFFLVNRYVIHSENRSSVHINNQHALIHDVILVLGKKAARAGKNWPMPDRINKTDSYRFCKECGALLGYLLSSDMDANRIKGIWDEKMSI